MASMTIDLTPPKPPTPSKTEPAKGGKGKVDAYKPVTGEPGKTESKSQRER
jgi:hypothetical protein